MNKIIITTRTNEEQRINRNCIEANIGKDNYVYCNVGNAQCTYLECTEKNNKINVKVIK